MYIVGLVLLLPAESAADEEDVLDKTKTSRGFISVSGHITATKNSPFLWEHSASFKPCYFQTQVNEDCSILLQYPCSGSALCTIQKDRKKIITRNVLRWGSNLKFRETPCGDINFCRICRILHSCSKLGSYKQWGKARAEVHAAPCPAAHPTSACFLWLLVSRTHQVMDQSTAADAEFQGAWALASCIYRTASKTGPSPHWQSRRTEALFCGILHCRFLRTALYVPCLTGFHEGNILACPKRWNMLGQAPQWEERGETLEELHQAIIWLTQC